MRLTNDRRRGPGPRRVVELEPVRDVERKGHRRPQSQPEQQCRGRSVQRLLDSPNVKTCPLRKSGRLECHLASRRECHQISELDSQDPRRTAKRLSPETEIKLWPPRSTSHSPSTTD